MIYRSIQLNDLLKQVGRKEVEKILADFSCPLNDDIEYFIHKKAIEFELVGLSRTTLIYGTQCVEDSPKLVAFYSLSPKELALAENLKRSERRQLFGTTYSLGQSIKSILIGQLSKNYTDGNDKLITGGILMSLIFEQIKKIDVLLSSTIVHIDCKDTPGLRNFYEKFGFKYYQTNDNLLCYVIPTKKIIEAERYSTKPKKEKIGG